MSQKTFDGAVASIFLGLVFLLTVSFTFGPTARFVGSLSADNMPSDLDAQRSMAVVAWFMFGAAMLQIVIGIVGIWFVRMTLVETQRSVEAAERGLKVMGDVSDQENRPWLSISNIRLTPGLYEKLHIGGMAQYFNLTCDVKNHGHSPAFNVGLIAWSFLREPKSEKEEVLHLIQEWRKSLDEGGQQSEAVFPGEAKEMRHMIAISDEEIRQAL